MPRPKKPTTPDTRVNDPETAWERFERLMRKVVRVPKEAIAPKDRMRKSEGDNPQTQL